MLYSKVDFISMNDYIFNSNIYNSVHVFTFLMLKPHELLSSQLFIPKFQLRSKQYPKWFTKDLHHQPTSIHLPITMQHDLSLAEDSFQYNSAVAKSTYETDLITNFANTSNPPIYRHNRSFTKFVIGSDLGKSTTLSHLTPQIFMAK